MQGRQNKEQGSGMVSQWLAPLDCLERCQSRAGALSWHLGNGSRRAVPRVRHWTWLAREYDSALQGPVSVLFVIGENVLLICTFYCATRMRTQCLPKYHLRSIFLHRHCNGGLLAALTPGLYYTRQNTVMSPMPDVEMRIIQPIACLSI